VKMHFKK